MSIIKQNYELSIWDVAAQKETKIAIIGANDMLSPARAQSPQLKRNINGTKTLTFSLYTKYIDEIDGERKINPFCNLIHNETRLKLKWKNKWYEFIVKNIVEDSENNKNTYIAEDAFILELSRKGFNIELNTDLENNQGTLIELEKKILKNSDWQVDEKNSLVGPQLKEDTLVKLITTKEIIVAERCEINSNGILEITKREFKIPAKATIYTFYSTIYKKDNFFQFYYNNEYKFGDDGFIINCPIYCIDDYKITGDLPANTKDYELTTYKGKQLIRTQQSTFDKLVNKYVKIYTNGSEEIRGYTTTEYVTDDFVRNIATNGKEFFSDLGWYPLSNKSELEFYSYPTAESILSNLSKNKTLESKSYIKIKPLVKNDYVCYNSGFEDNKDLIESLYNGKKFIIRLKYGYKKTSSSEVNKLDYDKANKLLTHGFKISLCQYDLNEDGDPLVTKVLFETSFNGKTENSFKLVNDYWTAICSCKNNYSKKELLDSNIGIFFSFDILNTSKTINSQNFKNYEFCIEEFEFFEYKEKEIDDNDQNERNYYLIGDTISGEARIKYNYFKPSTDYEEAEDIKYEYQGYEEKTYKKKFVPNYQQIRTIEGKESNIFNLTQTLCETFETWADFVVEHDGLGYTKKDSKGNFIKKIVFKPFIGKENWSGFHYKTNLKSIQRTTESKQITTKSIVKPNYNEFAPNGFSTIAYADENPSGESFIYDFRYYENQDLLDSKVLTEELHGKNGLYIKLKGLNNQIQKEITKRTDATTQILYWEKEKEVLTAKESELTTLIATNKKQFRTLTGTTYEKFVGNTKTQKKLMEMDEVPGLFLSIHNDVNELKKVKTQTTKAKEQYRIVKNTYNATVKQIKNLTSQKEKLILDFETKYSPFIQEGTWISNEYIDHNLYYVDAKTVAATSALPQVTYTINVLDLSALEEFKNYDVEIGDKTYITDPEFFGYVTTGMFYTPRRQEVIISEVIEELEEPEKNKFTVQNFKTQFEDIFHRITAATQQLKLNEGAYQRASGAFDNYGLDSTIAQNAFNSTNFVLVNNTNKWDSQGFISTSAKDKHQGLKIHDGAVFISKANGNWDKIISGKGINADYIYAGQLDAGKINIVSELKTSEDQELQYAVTFDKDGLSMYNYEDTKKIRLRLGKVLEDGETLSELYGLQLYNANGEQTFRTDSDGNISITGEITAGSGMIGGWGIEENRLVHYNDEEIVDAFISAEQGDFYSVNDYSSNNWRLLLGINETEANFGITENGSLFANGVDIRDGNISVGDIFKITTNGGKDQVMTYGLNIKLNPENQNEEIVIESDDRVIGIRERRQDGKGWTWKTILGDLTNATLGGKSLSDYGLSGYGLCTENGLFSGTIIASKGKIGNFEIVDNSILNKFDSSPNSSFFPSESEEQAKGIYLGADGRFFIGNETNFIKFGPEEATDKIEDYSFKIRTKGIDFTVGDSFENVAYISIDEHFGQNALFMHSPEYIEIETQKPSEGNRAILTFDNRSAYPWIDIEIDYLGTSVSQHGKLELLPYSFSMGVSEYNKQNIITEQFFIKGSREYVNYLESGFTDVMGSSSVEIYSNFIRLQAKKRVMIGCNNLTSTNITNIVNSPYINFDINPGTTNDTTVSNLPLIELVANNTLIAGNLLPRTIDFTNGSGSIGHANRKFSEGHFKSLYTTEIILPNKGTIWSYRTDDTTNKYNLLDFNGSNNMGVGYGLYQYSKGTTAIYGNDITLTARNNIKLGDLTVATIKSNFTTINNNITTLQNAVADSGWQTPSFTSTFVANSNNPLKYRKIGKFVNIFGKFLPKSNFTAAQNESYQTIFTLPSGYRPRDDFLVVGQGVDNAIWSCNIQSSGVVQMARYRQGDTLVAPSSKSNMSFNVTFMVG